MLANRVRMGSNSKKRVKDDLSGSPGSPYLISGTMQEGFFGEVSASELITGDALASACGISEGISQHSTAGWLKFAWQGNIQFVAKKTFRHSISWDAINAANCVYGNKTVSIGGLTYKVRLMKGVNEDPSTGFNKTYNHYSEWNKLILPIHINAPSSWTYPDNVNSPTEDWGIDFTDSDLMTHYDYGKGTFSWCQETSSLSYRIARGNNGVSYSVLYYSTYAGDGIGWRPVLELVS
jgi:hypothetical protein